MTFDQSNFQGKPGFIVRGFLETPLRREPKADESYTAREEYHSPNLSDKFFSGMPLFAGEALITCEDLGLEADEKIAEPRRVPASLADLASP